MTPLEIVAALDYLTVPRHHGLSYVVLYFDDVELVSAVFGRAVADLVRLRQNDVNFATSLLQRVTPWKCVACGADSATLHTSNTAYAWAGTGVNPNRPCMLCDDCATKDDDFWTDQWSGT